MWHLLAAATTQAQSIALPLTLAVISVAGVIGGGVITVLHREGAGDSPRKIPDRLHDLEERADQGDAAHTRLHIRIDGTEERLGRLERRQRD